MDSYYFIMTMSDSVNARVHDNDIISDLSGQVFTMGGGNRGYIIENNNITGVPNLLNSPSYALYHTGSTSSDGHGIIRNNYIC